MNRRKKLKNQVNMKAVQRFGGVSRGLLRYLGSYLGGKTSSIEANATNRSELGQVMSDRRIESRAAEWCREMKGICTGIINKRESCI